MRNGFLAGICGIFGVGSALLAQPAPRSLPALEQYSAEIESIAAAARPAVVHIAVELRTAAEDANPRRAGFLIDQQASGSGAIIEPDGYILTNAHVVNGARKMMVAIPGRAESLPAKLIGLDREIDLAVIKVEATGLPTLDFVDSSLLKQGQFVIALGSPLGLENTLTVGIISATRRYLKPEEPMSYVQTDAPINPGNSGGPLLTSQARIAGINTMIMTQSGGSEGIGFAIPSNLAHQVYKQIRKEGRVRRGAIGVVPQTITSTLAKALGLSQTSGVILSDVVPHGAAEAAGLQPGDIVLTAHGKPLKSSRDLGAEIFQLAAGEQIPLEILRGTERLKKNVSVMERPGQPARLEELAAVNGSLVRRLGALVLPLDEKVAPLMPEIRRLSGVVVGAIPLEFAGRNPGLFPGDVIYSVNGKRVSEVQALVDELYARKPGDAIALQVERERQLFYVAFELE